MYITYYQDQRSEDIVDPCYQLNIMGGDYRPTWLIRTFDWKKVPGIEARFGYCTLSYCWEQSGEVIVQSNNKKEQSDDFCNSC
ncbi:hypothetical protein BDA99DRAFT_570161, partial [Phascolomyces articulosus]